MLVIKNTILSSPVALQETERRVYPFQRDRDTCTRKRKM